MGVSQIFDRSIKTQKPFQDERHESSIQTSIHSNTSPPLQSTSDIVPINVLKSTYYTACQIDQPTNIRAAAFLLPEPTNPDFCTKVSPINFQQFPIRNKLYPFHHAPSLARGACPPIHYTTARTYSSSGWPTIRAFRAYSASASHSSYEVHPHIS